MACEKIQFASKQEAMKQARGLSAKRFGGWRRGSFVTAYQCPECSGRRAVWHMSRSKPRPRRA